MGAEACGARSSSRMDWRMYSEFIGGDFLWGAEMEGRLSLGFDVDPEERASGRVWRDEIADEAELATEFDMAGAAAAVDDY